jgi:hypothetical protein
VSGGGQVLPGRFGDLRFQVDGGDEVVVAEPVGQQGRVETGPGADLQDRSPSSTASEASISAMSEGWLLEETSSPSRSRVASGTSS